MAADQIDHKDQDEQLEKPPPEAGTWTSSRYCIVYLAFLGFVNVYALRVNLSVAILSMVNSTASNGSGIDTECPAGPSSNKTSPGVKFDWDSNQQGLVLGAFFYGYIVTQIPGGYLAGRYGGKWLFGLGIFCTSVFSLITPIAAEISFPLLIAVRIVQGLGEGVTFPAVHAMLGRWAPPVERSFLVSLCYAGSQMGTVLAQPISGILCDSDFLGGWPAVFYVFGTVGIIWCIAWFIFASNSPEKHSRISQAELSYLQRTVPPADVNFDVPWRSIFTSVPVWAICISHMTCNWGFYTLLTCLPKYLNDILRFDISQSGFIASLPYLVQWICINIQGYIADTLRGKHVLNTTQTRKIFNTIGAVGPAIFLVSAGYVGCNKALAVGLICGALAFAACTYSSYNSNHIDIASRYSGVLMGITNTWATIPGFAGPAVVGLLTEKHNNRHQWQIVFYIAAAIYITGAILYALLASGVEQPWNKTYVPMIEEEDDDDDGRHIYETVEPPQVDSIKPFRDGYTSSNNNQSEA